MKPWRMMTKHQQARARVETCLSKIAYDTFEEADKIRVRNSSKMGKPLKVYLCSRCKCYHLTSNLKFSGDTNITERRSHK